MSGGPNPNIPLLRSQVPKILYRFRWIAHTGHKTDARFLGYQHSKVPFRVPLHPPPFTRR